MVDVESFQSVKSLRPVRHVVLICSCLVMSTGSFHFENPIKFKSVFAQIEGGRMLLNSITLSALTLIGLRYMEWRGKTEFVCELHITLHICILANVTIKSVGEEIYLFLNSTLHRHRLCKKH